MNRIAVALAHELGNHIDDLVDSGITAIDMPDAGGEVVGHLLDTSLADAGPSNSFIVLVVPTEGVGGPQRRIKVTCEELA